MSDFLILVLRSLAKLLTTRKVQVALTTGLTAWLGDKYGLRPEITALIVGLGVSVIAGIAIEDHGAKSAGGQK